MEDHNVDKDFFEIFINLIDDEDEINLLKKVLEGKTEEQIVNDYIETLGEISDDQS